VVLIKLGTKNLFGAKRMQVTLHEAAAQLSALGQRAWAGERIVIAQDGKPYLELIPHQKERKRRPGRFKGKIKISDDFTETPADIFF
jgi:antitoxin (DNA-binding transcriptional repressor) of toxin-antitoxin stability system